MNDLNEIKKIFFERGWIKVPKFFDKEFIANIHYELDFFIKEIAPNLEEGDIHYSGKEINSIHVLSQNSEFFNTLLNNPKVVDLMNHILDGPVEPQWVQYFAKPPLVGKAAPMHQDNFYWCVKNAKTVTMWIALDEVNAANGGVSYYNYSHTKGILEHKPSFAKGTSQSVSESAIKENLLIEDKIVPDLDPGDLLLHHGNMVHGSEDNITTKSRRGLSMWYKSVSAEIDEVALEKYQESLKKQHDIIYSKKA